MSSTRAYYEHYWSAAGFSPREALDPHVADLYGRYINPSSRCLEVGCGDGGKNGTWIIDHADTYVGVDISDAAVGMACASGLDARVIEDAAELPFEDDAFDFACCTEVLEHLFRPDEAAREIGRVLKPGATLVVTVPNIAYWRRRVDFLLLGRWHPGGDDLSVRQPWRDPHIRFFNRGALARMLEDSGFDVLGVSGFEGGVISELPVLRRLHADRLSAIYGRCARRFPGLLARRLSAVAQLPPRISS